MAEADPASGKAIEPMKLGALTSCLPECEARHRMKRTILILAAVFSFAGIHPGKFIEIGDLATDMNGKH